MIKFALEFIVLKLVFASIIAGTLIGTGLVPQYHTGATSLILLISLCVEYPIFRFAVHLSDVIESKARRASNKAQPTRKRKLNFSPELNARIEKHLNDLEGRN